MKSFTSVECTTQLGGNVIQVTLSFITILIVNIAGIIYIMSYVEKRLDSRRQFALKRLLNATRLKLDNDRREARDAFDLWWETDGKLTAEQFARDNDAMAVTDGVMRFDDKPEFVKEAARTIMVALIQDKVANYAIYLMTKLSFERLQSLLKVVATSIGDEARYEAQAQEHVERLKHDELSLIEWGYDLEQLQAHFNQQPVAA